MALNSKFISIFGTCRFVGQTTISTLAAHVVSSCLLKLLPPFNDHAAFRSLLLSTTSEVLQDRCISILLDTRYYFEGGMGRVCLLKQSARDHFRLSASGAKRGGYCRSG